MDADSIELRRNINQNFDMLILLMNKCLESLLNNLLHRNRARDHRSRLKLAYICSY